VKDTDFVTVGWAYGQADAALAVALLGSAGIPAFPHTWYVASVQWHWTHALGGIALQVPAAQAADAIALLADNPIVRRPRHWLWRLLVAVAAVMVLLWVGFPPPPSGFFPATQRPASGRLGAASGDTA